MSDDKSPVSAVADKPRCEPEPPVLLAMMAAWNDTFGTPLTRYAAMYRIAEKEILSRVSTLTNTKPVESDPAPTTSPQGLGTPRGCEAPIHSGGSPLATGLPERLRKQGYADVPPLATDRQPEAMALLREVYALVGRMGVGAELADRIDVVLNQKGRIP